MSKVYRFFEPNAAGISDLYPARQQLPGAACGWSTPCQMVMLGPVASAANKKYHHGQMAGKSTC